MFPCPFSRGVSPPVGERDVDPLLEAPEESGVQLPGPVGGAKQEELVRLAGVVGARHLSQQLRLDAPRVLLLVGAAHPADAVNLIDEDDLQTRDLARVISNPGLGLRESNQRSATEAE